MRKTLGIFFLCMAIGWGQKSFSAPPGIENVLDGASCQDGILNIIQGSPAFGYLRCKDKIYGFHFSRPLDGSLSPMCDLSIEKSDTRTSLVCKADNGQIVHLQWQKERLLERRFHIHAQAHYTTGLSQSTDFTVTILSPDWGAW